jgi:hypothetical protein
MHIKINRSVVNPNFLPHILWSKTKLKEPTTTTIAFVDLDLQNYDGKQA